MAPDNEAMRTTQIEWHPATKLPDHCSEVLVLLKDQQTSRVGHFDEHWYITEMRHHRAVSGVVMWAEMPEAPTPLDRATELESGSLEAQSAADIELASKCRYVGEMPNGVRVTFDRGVIYVGSTRMGAYGHGVPYMSKDWPRPPHIRKVTTWAYLDCLGSGTNIVGTLARVECDVIEALTHKQQAHHDG
jgi:hypothetical protein